MSIKQSINHHTTDFPYILYVCFVILIIPLIPSVAQSHKVNIFAYAEDDKIFTESYFNDGSPCKDSMIQVYDPDGNELLHGKTDEEGIFSFKIPQRADLRIVLTASMGHKAEYRMPATEIPDILSKKTNEPIPSARPQEGLEKEKPVKNADQNIRDDSSQPLIAFDLDQIRSVVEDAVDRSIEKRMKPLIHSMVRTQTSRVSLTDIIGGIGYIFGIMGIILYFKKRKK